MVNMERRGIADRVRPVLGTVDDPRLPEASCDLILLVDVYHEFDHPFEMARAMARALKPGGRLVLVEYRGEDPEVPIKPLHKMTEAQVELRRSTGLAPSRRGWANARPDPQRMEDVMRYYGLSQFMHD